MNARPTILGAMGVVAFVSVGMAASRTNGILLAPGSLAMTVFTLCTATIVAMDRGGAWAGFAVFGWAQFLICQPHAAPTPGPTTLAMRGVYEVLCDISMPTSVPLFFSDTGLVPFPRAYSLDGNWAVANPGPRTPGQRSGIIPLQSLRAALCLLSLIVGSTGALVGGFVSRRDDSAAVDQNRQVVVSWRAMGLHPSGSKPGRGGETGSRIGDARTGELAECPSGPVPVGSPPPVC